MRRDYFDCPGTSYDGAWDGWYGPSGREDPTRSYDISAVMDSSAGKAVRAAGTSLTPQQVNSSHSFSFRVVQNGRPTP